MMAMVEENRLPARSLSLILPAYNEAEGIGQAIAEAEAALPSLALDYEILVVDDGSKDATSAIVAEAARRNPHVRLLRHDGNLGYGRALRTGFEAARGDLVAFTDADCQFFLDDLSRLIPLTEEADLAVGIRVDRQDPWRRRFYSWGYNQIVRRLLGTGVRDCDCALKVFRKEALAGLLPETEGFFVNAEMLSRANQQGLTVVETGVRHRPRTRGSSTVSLSDIPRTLSRLLPYWWSRVLFAGSLVSGPIGLVHEHDAPARERMASRGLGLIVVFMVAALLFFSRLNCPLQEPEEPRYAEIPRQMMAEGRFALPILNGLPYYDKPPLLYWLVMGSYSLFGVHDWSARLVSSLAGFLVVLTTYAWGRAAFHPRAAFIGAMILCLSGRFIYLSRLLTMNSLLCLCVVAAWAAAHVAMRRHSTKWWLLAAVACGLGVLTKGLVALVLVVVPIGMVSLLDNRLARPLWRSWAAFFGIAVGMSVPWFVAMTLQDPSFPRYFFWRHHVERFVTPFDHEKPLWYFLPEVGLGMLPWTLLLPSLLAFLASRSASVARLRPGGLGVCCLAFGWSLCFFSLGGSKRAGYILPALPPLALALGCFLDVALSRLPRMHLPARWGIEPARLADAATMLVLGASCIATAAAGTIGVLGQAQAGLLIAAILVGGIALWSRGGTASLSTRWLRCGAATFLTLWVGVVTLLPGYAQRFSMRALIQPQRQLVEDGDLPVLCYPRGWDSVSFYLGYNDVRTYSAAQRDELIEELRRNPSTLVVLKGVDGSRDLLESLPSSLEFVSRGRRDNFTVGIVRQTIQAAPATWYAQR